MANNSLSYVNSTNAQIYIGGILIDDIFDVQYAYKETKEPIYGYNSKHYDHIVPGNVLVHGSFSINYRHDGYLTQILNRIKGDSGDVTAAQVKIESAKAYNIKYKNLLSEYKSINAKIKAAKETVKVNEAGLQGQELTYNSTENIAERKINESQTSAQNAYGEYSSFYDNLGQEEADALQTYYNTCTKLREDREFTLGLINDYNNNIAQAKTELDSGQLSLELVQSKQQEIDDYLVGISNLTQQNKEYTEELNSQLSNIADDYPNVYSLIQAQVNSDDLDAVAETVYDYENAQIELDSDFLSAAAGLLTESKLSLASLQAKKTDLIKQLGQIKSEMDTLLPNWDKLSTQDAAKTNTKQPEDMGVFNIFLRINGMTHVILKDCVIVSHNLVVPGGSGESLKENYVFYAHTAK